MSDINSIFQVWDSSGYVFLPRKESGKNGKWCESKAFKWPTDKADVVAWIKDSHANKFNLYWCPCVFTEPRRVKENIKKMNVLYADLDECSPNLIPDHLRPTMMWESSPGRYAAVWRLNKKLPAEEAEILNKNLTYFLGADKGGWDLTQVLRVPGLHNYKYKDAPKGKLLWFDDGTLPISKFKELPDVEMKEEHNYEELEISDNLSLTTLIRPYLSRLSPKVLELLFTPTEDVSLNDRSSKLWELESMLAESKVNRDDIVKIISQCNWNKYKGRKDELLRITTEVDKVMESSTIIIPNTEEKIWTPYASMMAQDLSSPGWMIEGVWQMSSHGMIAGEPKTYKSMLVTDMMISVASGTPFLGIYPVNTSGPVMCIQEENAPWLVQDRVMKIANHRGLLMGDVMTNPLSVKFPPNLPLYFLNNKGFNLTNEQDQQFLEESIKEVKPLMVVFDSLYLMLGGLSENNSQDLRPVLNWLLHLRYKYHVSIILLHHWNKNGKSERGGQRMLGSVLFHAWVESAMYTEVNNELEHEIIFDREFRSFTKPKKLCVKFTMGDPGDLAYNPEVSELGDENKAPKGDVLLDYIKMMINPSVEDISAGLKGIGKRDLMVRLDKLVEDKIIVFDGTNYTVKEIENEKG